MRRLSRTIGVLVIACLSVAAVFGQTEKISLRMSPAPDQTVQMKMAQDMDINITFDGPALPGLTPMKMVMRTTTEMTQKVGPRKADGTVDAEVTYKQVTTEMSMNGQPLSTGNDPGKLENVTVTATYNRNGEIINIRGLPDTSALPADTLKQMMTSFYSNLPKEPIAVGEVVTTPVDLALPLPILGGSGMKMAMSTKTKLVSIENSAAGRAARLEASIDGKMGGDVPSPDAKGSMRFDFIMSGGGTTVIDLAKGVVRNSLVTTNMNGTIDMGKAAPAGVPPMKMSMTMTVTIAGN